MTNLQSYIFKLGEIETKFDSKLKQLKRYRHSVLINQVRQLEKGCVKSTLQQI